MRWAAWVSDPPSGRPKYALAELERRWLVAAERLAGIELPFPAIIHDRYLADSRLRLRRIEEPGGAVVHKLCKKYGDTAAGGESITNLYLSAPEYALLEALPGWLVHKLRHRCSGGSLDHYQNQDEDVWVFEREFADPETARAYDAPDFVIRDITGDGDFSGVALARRFGTLCRTRSTC